MLLLFVVLCVVAAAVLFASSGTIGMELCEENERSDTT